MEFKNQKEIYLKILNNLESRNFVLTQRNGIICEIACFNLECDSTIKILNSKNKTKSKIICPKCNKEILKKEYLFFANIAFYRGVLIDFNIDDFTKKQISNHFVLDHHNKFSTKSKESATSLILDFFKKFENNLDMINFVNSKIESFSEKVIVFVSHFDIDCLLGVFCFRNFDFAKQNSNLLKDISFYEDIMLIKNKNKEFSNILTYLFENFKLKYLSEEIAFNKTLDFTKQVILNPSDFKKFKKIGQREIRIKTRKLNKKKYEIIENFVILIKFKNKLYQPIYFHYLIKDIKNYNDFPFTMFIKFNLENNNFLSFSFGLNSNYKYFQELNLDYFYDLILSKEKSKKEKKVRELINKKKDFEKSDLFSKKIVKIFDNVEIYLNKIIYSKEILNKNEFYFLNHKLYLFKKDLNNLNININLEDFNLNFYENFNKENLELFIKSINEVLIKIYNNYNLKKPQTIRNEIKKINSQIKKEKKKILNQNCWSYKKNLILMKKVSCLNYDDILEIINFYKENYFDKKVKIKNN